MKTYHANYTKSALSSRAKMAGWAVFIAYDDEVSHFRFATHDNNVAGSLFYTGIVDSVEFGEGGFDPYTGSNLNQSCTIRLNDELVNGAHVTTSLLSGKGYVNRYVKVYRYIDLDMSAVSNDEEFYGKITKTPWYDLQSCQWVFEAELIFEHRTIPQTTISKEDYPRAPKQSIGSPIPLLYGIFTMSTTGTRGDAAHGLFHYAPTICIDSTKGLYVAAEHAVSAITDDTVGIYLSAFNTYGVGLYAWDGAAADYPDVVITGPSTIQIAVAVTAASGVFKVGNVWISPTMKGIYNQVSADSDNVVDLDYNTSLTVGASTRYSAKFLPGSINSNGGEFAVTGTTQQLKTFSFFTAHSGSAITGGIYNPINATAYSPGGNSGTGYKTWAISAATTGTRSDNEGTTIASANQWTWDEIILYEYYLSVPAASSVDISTFGIVANDIILTFGTVEKVKESIGYFERATRSNRPGRRPTRGERTVYRYSNDSNAQYNGLSNIFVECSGRKFGSWIGSRNGLGTSNIISTSNYIAESILRDEMSVTDNATIDTTAFDNAYSGAATMAFSINKKVSTQTILEDIAEQSFCYIFKRSSGEWTILPIPTSAASSDVDLDYSLGDVKINAIYKSPQEWVENQVRVLYNYDYARGEFAWDTNDENTTSKGTTYLGTNSTSIVEIGANLLRKDSNSGATDYAVSLRDSRLFLWGRQHNIVEFDVLNMSYFSLEEGDKVTFQNVSINYAGIGAGSAGDYWSSFADSVTEYWLIFSRTPFIDKVSYKAIQIHEL
jgi:hypothetical protein